MQSLVSLEGYDPELREYLLRHRWPSVMEALLTGLTVMTPRDPWEFVIQQLKFIQNNRISEISRDLFVAPSVRPLLQRGPLHTLLDNTDQIEEEELEKAYQFRGKKLCRWCFRAWLQFHSMEKTERAEYLKRLHLAEQHYVRHIRTRLLHVWRGYTQLKKTSRREACSILLHLRHSRLKKRLLAAWLEDTREIVRTRAWFNKQKKEGEGEGGEWFWPEGEDSISLLEKSLSVKIFTYVGLRGLCRCSQVCRSWKAITDSSELWNRLDLSPLGQSLRDSSGLVRVFHKYRPLLGHLSLRGCCSLSPDTLKVIAQCHNLQDLNLSECQGITDEVMDLIVRGCSGLLYLNLSYCYVTDSIIRILAKRCASLHYLSLAHCLHFTSKGLRSIQSGRGCRRLVYLDLSGCTQLTAEGMLYLGAGCPILNTLLLDDIPSITDAMMLKLIKHCKTLRHLSLLGSSRLSDTCFKHTAKENRKLRSIKIENNPVLTDSTLKALARCCRDLQHVYLAGCGKVTDKGLMELKRLKKLLVVNIADCNRVSDLGIRHILEGASHPNLRELNVTNCLKLSDITLLRLTAACLSLTHLSLSYCEHISDSGVELLNQLPQLYSLDLTGCTITDQGVASLHNNSRYRHLGLAELVDITDDGVQRMCSTLSLLETLDLSDCDRLTNQGLQSIAYHCHLLRQLHLANCYMVGDDGVKYLSKGCTYLTHLDLSGCVITDKALKQLWKGCPHLRTLNILCCVNITRDEVQRYQNKGLDISYNTDRPKYLHDMPGLADLEVEHLIDRI